METDSLVVSREEPEIVALAVVLLAEHPGEAGAFLLQHLVDIGCGGIPDDFAVVLVFLHHDDDVIVNRESFRPLEHLGLSFRAQ